MFKFEDLDTYSIEVDFSKNLESMTSPTNTEAITQMLGKISLKTLEVKSFEKFEVLMRELDDLFPRIQLRKTVGEYMVELHIFRRKKMRLRINRTEIISVSAPEEQSKQEAFTQESIRGIGADFDFLFSRILGILKLGKAPKTSVLLEFEKHKSVPSGKLQVLNRELAKILGNRKIDIRSFKTDFIDDANLKHTIGFSRSEKAISTSDSFDYEPSGAINLPNILENSLKLLNDNYRKIFG